MVEQLFQSKVEDFVYSLNPNERDLVCLMLTNEVNYLISLNYDTFVGIINWQARILNRWLFLLHVWSKKM